MDGAGDGEPLPQDVEARRAQYRRVQRPLGRCRGQGRERDPGGADRVRPGNGAADFRAAALRHEPITADRRRGRRNGGSDDGRGQGNRGGDPASGTDGPSRRDPPDHGDATPVRRRHHRHDQGEFPDPHQLSGDIENRQPHDPRRRRRRAAPRPGRPALYGRRRAHHPGPRPVRLRRRGRARRLVPENARDTGLHRRDHRG